MEGGQAGGVLLSPTHTAVPRPQRGLHGKSCLADRLPVNDRARPWCQLGTASRRSSRRNSQQSRQLPAGSPAITSLPD